MFGNRQDQPGLPAHNPGNLCRQPAGHFLDSFLPALGAGHGRAVGLPVEIGIRKATPPVTEALGGNKYLGLPVHAEHFTPVQQAASSRNGRLHTMCSKEVDACPHPASRCFLRRGARTKIFLKPVVFWVDDKEKTRDTFSN